MKLRTISKLGIILSVILFCIGVGFYSFAQLSKANEEGKVDFLSFVPSSCVSLLETDNIDHFINEFPQTNYFSQIDTIQNSGIIGEIFNKLKYYASTNAHGINQQMNHIIISFHKPVQAKNAVLYFNVDKAGKNQFFKALCRKLDTDFAPRKEKYRGETIEIYPIGATDFIATYSKNGLLAISSQKKLIEEVIDAHKNETSMRECTDFATLYQPKSTNSLTLYGNTPPLPVLTDTEKPHWSEFNVHINSDVFYLSGIMPVPAPEKQELLSRLSHMQPVKEDSLLILAGKENIDNHILSIIASPSHTLFDECVSNLSREASFIMVADGDKISRQPEQFKDYLPGFILKQSRLFRPFILSVQITESNNQLSHIFTFTYKN